MSFDPAIESFVLDLALVAVMRPNPSRYIKESCQKARKTWARKGDKPTRDILKLLVITEHRVELLQKLSRDAHKPQAELEQEVAALAQQVAVPYRVKNLLVLPAGGVA